MGSRSSGLGTVSSSQMCGSAEAEGMRKDLAAHWEHFSDFTFYIQVLLLRHSSYFVVTVWVAIS